LRQLGYQSFNLAKPSTSISVLDAASLLYDYQVGKNKLARTLKRHATCNVHMAASAGNYLPHQPHSDTLNPTG
jgi:hypothetical protein